MSRYAAKKGAESLELLVSCVQDIQSGLTKEYHSKVIHQNQLPNTVKDVHSCKLAYFTPASDLFGIIADLQASLAAIVSKTGDERGRPNLELRTKKSIDSGKQRSDVHF